MKRQIVGALSIVTMLGITGLGTAAAQSASSASAHPHYVRSENVQSEETGMTGFQAPNVKGERIVIVTPRDYVYQDVKTKTYLKVLGYKGSHLPGGKTFLWAKFEVGNHSKSNIVVDPVTANVNLFVQIPDKDLPQSLRPKLPRTNITSFVSSVEETKAVGVHVTGMPVTVHPGQSKVVTWGVVLNGTISPNTLKNPSVRVLFTPTVSGKTAHIAGSIF